MSNIHYILYNEDIKFGQFYNWLYPQVPVGIIAHSVKIQDFVNYIGFIDVIHVYCSTGIGNGTPYSGSMYTTQVFLKNNMDYILNNNVRIIFHSSAAAIFITDMLQTVKFEKKFLHVPKPMKLMGVSYLYEATFLCIPVGVHKNYYLLFDNSDNIAVYQKSKYYLFIFFDVISTNRNISVNDLLNFIRDDNPDDVNNDKDSEDNPPMVV